MLSPQALRQEQSSEQPPGAFHLHTSIYHNNQHMKSIKLLVYFKTKPRLDKCYMQLRELNALCSSFKTNKRNYYYNYDYDVNCNVIR